MLARICTLYCRMLNFGRFDGDVEGLWRNTLNVAEQLVLDPQWLSQFKAHTFSAVFTTGGVPSGGSVWFPFLWFVGTLRDFAHHPIILTKLNLNEE